MKKGRDLSDAEDRGMDLGGEDLSCKGQRHGSRGIMTDMISLFIRVFPSMPKGEIVD
jgi:hypothetical protein